MRCIELETSIDASCERVFDLARSVDVHLDSTRGTGERAIAGVTSGLLELGDEVTWRARHFGIWQSLRARITIFDRPRHFRDSMVSGAFRRFDHDHFFDHLVLKAYLTRFLCERNAVIRKLAEGRTF